MKPITPIIGPLFVAVLACAVAAPARGRTIELSDTDADRIAMIASEAPRLSWAGIESAPGMFADSLIIMRPHASMLIHMPLDKIPAGMRITKAQWIIKPTSAGGDAKLYVWRVLGDWGAGVCYQYRMIRPRRVEWTQAGARASASDRSDRPTASAPCKTNEDVILNVTQDVELWHSGAARNTGWMFTVEDDVQMYLPAPTASTRGSWKLRITYEPQ